MQLSVPNPLDDQISSKSICRLYYCGLRVAALDAFKYRGEARSHPNRIGAIHGSVAELGDELVTCAPRKTLDRVPLALIAILVKADISGRRCA